MNERKWKTVTVIAVLCLLCWSLTGCGADRSDLQALDAEVTVSDGVVTPTTEHYEIEVTETGTYQFLFRCKPDHGGLITGFRICDVENEILLQATCEEMTMDSEKMELESGTYTLQLCYLNQTEDWKNFVEEGGTVFSPTNDKGESDEDYVFGGYGIWKIQMEYGVRSVEPDHMYYPAEIAIGLVAGIVAGIALVYLLLFLIRKAGGRFEISWQIKGDSYDERQQIERGKGYKAGFYTLVIYVFAASVLNDVFNIPLLMSFAGMWLGVSAALLVFAVHCIRSDAYMSLYENPKGLILMFLLGGLLNLVIGVVACVRRGIILENGALCVNLVNVEVGILLLVVLWVFIARLLRGQS